MQSDQANAILSNYRFPDELRVNELLLRPPNDADVDAVAPAFRDPAVGGEASLPPVGPERLREMLHEQLPQFRAEGRMSPYVVVDTRDGTILGGAQLHRFDPMRDVVEVGCVLERLGFRREGVKRRFLRLGGERVDATLFALLADDA